jgi:5-formyltetrahydrofolate cyclo-ligase
VTGGDVAAEKAALRAAIRARRAARGEAELAAAGAALAEHAGAVVDVVSTRPIVAAFVGAKGEPPTLPLLDALLDCGLRVMLPILRSDMDLDWGEYAGTASLEPARLGLLEPIGPGLGQDAVAEADLVLAPALAVDRTGRRLGQGGGSYDRALPRATARVIAVVFDDEVLDAVPAESHDRRVDGILTPRRGLSDPAGDDASSTSRSPPGSRGSSTRRGRTGHPPPARG